MIKKLTRLSGFLLIFAMLFAFVPVYAANGSIELNQTITGALSDKSDSLEYTLTLPTPGALTLQFKHPSQSSATGSYWRIGLYDSTDAQILTFDSTGSQTTLSAPTAYLGAGVYTIKITAPYSGLYFSTDSFELKTDYVENTGSFEIEGNDSRDTATAIALNTPVTGNLLLSSDTDYYKLTLSQAGQLILQITHSNQESTGNFWQFTLFDEKDTIITDFMSAGNQTSHQSINLYLDAGTYYLRAKCPYAGLYYSNSDYTVKGEFAVNTGAFETEPNDTQAKASPLTAKHPSATGNLHLASDADYYSFSVNGSGSVQLNFAHPNTESTGSYWTVSIYNQKDEQLLSRDIPGTETDVTTDPIAVSAGETYYVKVVCTYTVLYYSSADYVLSVHASNTTLTSPVVPALVATPATSTVMVDGAAVAFDAYLINQNNYFKLRDLAYVLTGTGAQFEVSWNGVHNAISITTDEAYTVVGGELAGSSGGNKTPVLNSARILINGTEVYLTAYTIDQNNYIKLRDLGEAIDFGVDWDGGSNTVLIDSTKGYTP